MPGPGGWSPAGRLLIIAFGWLTACHAADVRFDTYVIGTEDLNQAGAPARPVIRFGTPLALDRQSRFAELSQILRRSYELFFEWLNNDRGGINIGGVRHRAELVLVGDKSDVAVSEAVARHIIDDMGIKLLLAPFGSASTHPVARVVNSSGGVMVAPASSSPSVFEGVERVFGILTPSTKFLQPALSLVGARVKSVMVFRESAGFAIDACSVVPGAITDYGLEDKGVVVVSLDPDEASGEVSPAQAVARMGETAPELVIGCVYEQVCMEVIKQMRDQNFNPLIVVSTVCVTFPGFTDELGDASRWVLGATPWTPGLPLTSALTGLTAMEFTENYVSLYGQEPPYQGAMAFAAGEAMVVAIETAGTVDPYAVAQALHAMDLETVAGNVRFDSNRQNQNEFKVVQYRMKDTMPRLVAPVAIATSQLAFPMPPWNVRRCYAVEPEESIYGFVDGSTLCRPCPGEQVARFNDSLGWRQCKDCDEGRAPFFPSRNLSFCRLQCEIGHVPDVYGTCSPCARGFMFEQGSCVECGEGRYAPEQASMTCLQCAPGSFAAGVANSECELCDKGQALSTAGATECISCRPGLHSGVEGLAECVYCPAGTFTDEERMSECLDCPAGSFAPWGATECTKCPVGTYQPFVGRGTCIEVGVGAQAQQEGLVQPTNLQYYWAARKPDQEGVDGFSPESCRYWPKSCLENERCVEGHTGRQCLVCLPYYARQRGGCFYCTSRLLHLSTTIVIMCVVVAINLAFAGLTKDADTRPQDVHTILVKQVVNHLVMMSISREIIDQILAQLELKNVGRESLAVARYTISFVDWGDGVFPFLETIVWSLGCLSEAGLSAEKEALIQQLEEANHSYFMSDALAPARQALETHHYISELWHTMLWIIWPILLNSIISFVGGILLYIDLRKHKDVYQDALDFYREVHTHGFELSSKKHHSALVKKYTKLYYKRILGMWWPARHARVYIRKGFFDIGNWWQECHQLRLVTVFFGFAATARGVLRGMRCVRFDEDEASVLWSRPDVVCGMEVFVPSIIGFLIWCVIYPIWLYIGLRGAVLGISSGETVHRWSFLTNGYKPEYSWWEVVMYWRKIVMIICLSAPFHLWHESGRVLAFFCAAMIFCILHIMFDPYDQRKNNIISSIENHQLMTWMLMGIIMMLLEKARDDAIAMFCPICCVVLHTFFIVRICYNFYGPLLEFLKEVLDDPDNPPAPHTYRRQIIDAANAYVKERDDHSPYVALDHLYGWVSLLGSHGGRAVAPHIPKGHNVDSIGTRDSPYPRISEELDMSIAKHVHVPTQHQYQRLQRILQTTINHIVVDPEAFSSRPVFSTCVTEFIVRAAFIIHGYSRRSDQVRGLEPEEAGMGIWRRANLKRDPIVLQKSADEEVRIAAAKMDIFGAPESWDDTLEEKGSVMEDELRGQHMSLLIREHNIAKMKIAGQLIMGASKKRNKRTMELQRQHLMTLTDQMFSAAPFRRGITLEAMELALLSMVRLPREELDTWMNIFEARWLIERVKSHKVLQQLAGSLHEQETTAYAHSFRKKDNLMDENIAAVLENAHREERAAREKVDKQSPTRESTGSTALPQHRVSFFGQEGREDTVFTTHSVQSLQSAASEEPTDHGLPSARESRRYSSITSKAARWSHRTPLFEDEDILEGAGLLDTGSCGSQEDEEPVEPLDLQQLQPAQRWLYFSLALGSTNCPRAFHLGGLTGLLPLVRKRAGELRMPTHREKVRAIQQERQDTESRRREVERGIFELDRMVPVYASPRLSSGSGPSPKRRSSKSGGLPEIPDMTFI